jgi:3-phosphoshikimate 1-carboxyvinyltransferase
MSEPQKQADDTLSLIGCGPLRGELRVPGDKSISHRAVMFASLASGQSHIDGFLTGEDSLNTMRAFQAMGVNIEQTGPNSLRIDGVGMHGLQAPASALYMGNAGTGMRLISGILAAQAFDTELTGDESLSARPMGRIIDPLTQMGAQIGSSDGKPPLKISGGRPLTAIHYALPMASAQVKSCVLLAGLYAEGETCVSQPAITRDHTERMLQSFGYSVQHDEQGARLTGGAALHAADVDIPADISSAAFFLVAASIVPDSDVTLRHVGVNPSRCGIIDILKLMGADIEIFNQRDSGAEPVADLRVRGAQLQGVDIPEALVPLAIDELPVVFVAAACASGTTRVTGAEELRVKESDRIGAMQAGLAQLGVDATATADGMIVRGGKIGGGTVDTFFDHRIAMSFAVAALRASAPVTIRDTRHVETSFPGFFEQCETLGMQVTRHG